MDILDYFSFEDVGRHKLERLAKLARRTTIKLVADNEAVLGAVKVDARGTVQ